MDSQLALIESFPAASDYLSEMFLIQRDYHRISNQMLAGRLGVSTSAVTQATGRLKKLGLVKQQRYGDLHLSAEGSVLARVILRRHYLLEHLLVRTLGYPWDKSDAEARVLQNHISPDLADHLDAMLGHPLTCPHGNPLPGSPLEEQILQAPRLDTLKPGTPVEILRITEEGEAVEDMLPFCQRQGIRPGFRCTLLGRDEGHLILQDTGGREILLPLRLAAFISGRTES